jgi:hypothetical protein
VKPDASQLDSDKGIANATSLSASVLLAARLIPATCALSTGLHLLPLLTMELVTLPAEKFGEGEEA